MIRTLFALLTVSVALLATSASALAAGPSRGYYQCYQTVETQNLLTGQPNGYFSVFATSFWLKAHHKYQVSILTAGVNRYGQRYAVKNNTLRFVNGIWNDNMSFWHLKGTVHPHGVTMPNAQGPLNPARKYTVVLRGRSGDTDTAPPTHEFTGPVARSFWYCAKG